MSVCVRHDQNGYRLPCSSGTSDPMTSFDINVLHVYGRDFNIHIQVDSFELVINIDVIEMLDDNRIEASGIDEYLYLDWTIHEDATEVVIEAVGYYSMKATYTTWVPTDQFQLQIQKLLNLCKK